MLNETKFIAIDEVNEDASSATACCSALGTQNAGITLIADDGKVSKHVDNHMNRLRAINDYTYRRNT